MRMACFCEIRAVTASPERDRERGKIKKKAHACLVGFTARDIKIMKEEAL